MMLEGSPLEGPGPALSRLLDVGLGAKPGEPAMVSAERELSWREVDERTSALAAAYLGLGLEPGDRVASLMPNRIDLAVHYLACFRVGLVAVPLNYRYTHREIDHALGVCGASALLAHAERGEDLAASSLVGELPLGVITYGGAAAPAPDAPAAPNAPADRDLEALIAAAGELPAVPAPEPTDPAAIFFTSGSTGPSKGVTHTHESLRWMITSAGAALELTPEDTFLPGSSMSHLGSFLWSLAMLGAGGRVVVARTFDAHELLPLLREYRPTVLAMIPAALSALVHDHDLEPEDFSSLRVCRAGADAVSTELLADFSKLAGFPIDEGYGMSEIGLATLNPPSGVIKQGSIGQPVPGFSIRVLSEDREHVSAGEVGQICMRSRSRMRGYWEAPGATEEVLDDGWLDSGDLARYDEDGYLHFFGRKKQVIVHDGSNISPPEVESSLDEHPAVELAGVVGVHDEVHGENVRAYVTLREGAERPSSADLIVFSRERVGYKAPEEVIVLEEMPLNPTGKIDRTGLKRMASEHLHPHLTPE